MTLYSKQFFSQKWLNHRLIAFFLLICCCLSINLNAQNCPGVIGVDIENNGNELCADSDPVPVVGRLFVNPGTYNYTWSATDPSAVSFDVISGSVTVSSPGTQVNVTLTPEQAISFTVIELTITDPVSGCTLPGGEPIQIYEPVTADIGNGSIVNVCQDGSVALDGIPNGGSGIFTHLWEVVSSSPQPGTAALILDNPAAEDPVLTPPTGTPDGQTYNLRYTVATNDDNCSVATKDISITVRENASSASLSSTENFNELCPGDDAVMTLSITTASTNPYTYSAVLQSSTSGENFTVSNIPNGGDVILNPTETTTYTLVSVTNQFNCAVSTVSGSVDFVVDETRPSITAPDSQDLEADANCAAVIPNLLDVVTASDNCDTDVALSQSPAPGTPFIGGTTHNSEQDVTITATDDNGNERTHVITLILKDVTAPTFDTCPTAGFSQSTDDNVCNANVSFPEPSFTENCNGNISVTTDNENISIATTDGTTSATFPLGSTQVTYTVSDGVNPNATCSFTVTISDNVAPTITCPDSEILNNDNDECTAVFSYNRPTGIDNCAGNLQVQESNDNAVNITTEDGVSTGTFPEGTTMVTYTVSDGTNTGVPCSFTVTVNDTQVPDISDCPNSQTVDAGADCQTLVTWTEPTANDNCSNEDLTFEAATDNGTVITDGSGVFPIGVTNITYTANDGHNTPQTCIFSITIEDNAAPTITCADNSENIIVGTDENCGGLVPDLTSNLTNEGDNCPGLVEIVQSPAAGTDFSSTQDVTISATDATGNTAQCVYTIELRDIEAPVAGTNCPIEPIEIENTSNSCSRFYDFNTPDFFDNCSTNLEYTATTDDVTVTLTENPDNPNGGYMGVFPVGTTQVTITATDEAGLEGQCIFDVVMIDFEAPDITCPSDQTLVADPGQCGNSYTATPATASDNCTNPTPVTHDFEGGVSDTDASGFYPVGINLVTWTATDAGGNTTSCVQTIEVQDLEDPTLTCPNQFFFVDILIGDDDCITLAPNFIGDEMGNNADDRFTFADNCAFNLVQTPAAGTPIGTAHGDTEDFNIVITDASGNSASCNFTVRMQDETAPTVECTNITVNNNPGSCQGTIPNFIGDASGNGSDPAITFNDNCNFTIEQSVTAGSTFNAPTQNVTITITDDNDNEASCDVLITLVDVEAPMFNEDLINQNITVNTSSFGGYNCSGAVPDRTLSSLYTRTTGSGDNQVTTRFATDNCTGFNELTFSQNITPGTEITEDTDLIVFVTDAVGNTDEITIHLTLRDNEAPRYVTACPDDIVVDTDFNECDGTASWVNPTFEDNCNSNLDNPTIMFGSVTDNNFPYDLSGTTQQSRVFNAGETTVTYRSTDGSNVRTCTFTVTVNLNNDWVNDFTPNDGATIQKNNRQVNFNFTGSGASQFFWIFGDGNSSFAQNPTHTFPSFGSYNVCLAINDCFNTLVCHTITVAEQPNNIIIKPNDGNTVLSSFYAQKQGENVELNWETTSEYDLESFTLEASRNGIDFEDLTDIAGEGNSLNLIHEYAHTDEYAVEGYNFYRLRQNNMDGTFSYSEIVSAQLKTDRPNLQVTAYPNPVTDVLYLQLPKDSEQQNVQLEMYNLQGQMVLRDFVSYSNDNIELNLSDLQVGNHILVVKMAEEVFTKQIVIQR